MVSDTDIANSIEWHPVRKYAIFPDGREKEFVDDIHCGNDLWEIQESV